MKRLFLLALISSIAFAQKPDWVTGVQRKPIVDAREYGAVGNGTTDNASSIQKAIDSVSSGQAVTIVLSAGTYLLNSSPTANGRYPFFLFIGEASTSGVGVLPGNIGKFNRHFTMGVTHSAIPASMNTIPGYTMGQFVDGTATSPVTDSLSAMLFQRHNATASGPISSFVFHALNYSGASAGFFGPIALTGSVTDASVGKGGVGVRSVIYMDKDVFNTSIVSCTNTNPITVTVTNAIPAYATVAGITIRGVTGNTACNVENAVPTFSNGSTFTIPAIGNGTSSGGTAYVLISGFAGWDSATKTKEHTRLVARESDLANWYADSPLSTLLTDGVYEADTGHIDATINTSLNSAGYHNTAGLSITGDSSSGYFYPILIGVGATRDNGIIIDARNADRIPGAGLRSNVSFAKIANNNPIKYQSTAFGASYTVLNMNANADTIVEGHPLKSIKIGPGQTVTGYLYAPTLEVTSTTAKVKELQTLTGVEGSCDVANAGRQVFILGGAGVASTFKVCGKSVADTYSWAVIAAW
jgi:hypothetical protein